MGWISPSGNLKTKNCLQRIKAANGYETYRTFHLSKLVVMSVGIFFQFKTSAKFEKGFFPNDI